MARSTWHAYYFDSFDRSAPAARMATIEAANEDGAVVPADAQDAGARLNRELNGISDAMSAAQLCV